MGLFDFFKKNNSKLFNNDKYEIELGTNEIIEILSEKNHFIKRKEISIIFVKTYTISKVSKEFSLERLKTHLDGYGIDLFNDSQLEKLYNYLRCFHNMNKINTLLYELFPSGHFDRIHGGKTLIDLSSEIDNNLYKNINLASIVFTKLFCLYQMKDSEKLRFEIEKRLTEHGWSYKVDTEKLRKYLILCSNLRAMKHLDYPKSNISYTEFFIKKEDGIFRISDEILKLKHSGA